MIIRANQLRVGDVFLKQFGYYRVQAVEDGKIKCTVQSDTGGRSSYSLEIGINSLERVELISRLAVIPRKYKGSYRWNQRLSMSEFAVI